MAKGTVIPNTTTDVSYPNASVHKRPRSSRVQSRIRNPIVIQRHGVGTSSGYDEESVSEGEHGSKIDSGASTKGRDETTIKIDTSLLDRIFRLEDNFIKVTRDIGIMKGDIGILRWQMGVLLVAVVGFGGTLLGGFMKQELLDRPEQPKIPEQPMQLKRQGEFMSLVEDVKAINNTLKTMTDVDTKKNTD
ncbi:hypothetical protein EV426DRAFT_609203 [Tirmania nivea]|nr:hypothetical protein EV426DRAFT_609203 [Tirmania nivea]